MHNIIYIYNIFILFATYTSQASHACHIRLLMGHLCLEILQYSPNYCDVWVLCIYFRVSLYLAPSTNKILIVKHECNFDSLSFSVLRLNIFFFCLKTVKLKYIIWKCSKIKPLHKHMLFSRVRCLFESP